ncbi:MAG: hypothetical protein AAFV29_25885, partial [Myxococcota bacterium]
EESTALDDAVFNLGEKTVLRTLSKESIAEIVLHEEETSPQRKTHLIEEPPTRIEIRRYRRGVRPTRRSKAKPNKEGA